MIMFPNFRKVALLIAIVASVVSLSLAHSWMSCPRSLNPNAGRGGDQSGPCENFFGEPPVTQISAGERLKVGWVSNNHAGGYVRLSLVPWDQKDNAELYKQNVLKGACYGYDGSVASNFLSQGECFHPCDARPGCQWQASENDFERFDTTIAIPYNLDDGFYSLQWVALVGNGGTPYYSCAKLQVTGGNSAMSCARSGAAKAYACAKSNAGAPSSVILGNTKAGDFCFAQNGLGDIDSTIAQRPINYDCDPRTSCSLSVNAQSCAENLSGIADPNDPKQVCSGDTDDGNTDDGNTDDGNTDNGNTDDGNTDDGNTDDGNTDDGNSDDGNTDDGNTDDGSGGCTTTFACAEDPATYKWCVHGKYQIMNCPAGTVCSGPGDCVHPYEAQDNDTGDDGSNDDGSNDDGSNDDGSNDDGSNDDGSNDDGSNDDGSNDDGSNDDGSNDDGSNDDGSNDDGSNDEPCVNYTFKCKDDNPHAYLWCVNEKYIKMDCPAGTVCSNGECVHG
eukprot:Nk52_evm56s210 gene=Nk52_evmTU56s210